jgi:hypothetical protein
VCLQPIASSSRPWSLSTVYGPVDERLKGEFLDELREVHADSPGSLLLCGDFNVIYHYQAVDRNNDRLNFRSMRRFCRAPDDMGYGHPPALPPWQALYVEQRATSPNLGTY